MRIRHLSELGCKAPTPRVMALGLFDGVHRGHAALLSRTVLLARARGISAAVFTFSDGDFKSGEALLSFKDRAALFEELGIDEVFTARFEEVRDLSPHAFVRDLLQARLGTVSAVCGFNFRFGKGAVGTPELLTSLLPDSECLPPVLVDGAPCSATRAREALKAGELTLAERLLGRPYAVRGRVVHGKALGRTAGIPTANLRTEALLPKNGVYLTLAELDGGLYPAITDVGIRPTVEQDGAPRAETHIPDLTRDIYEEELRVTFVRRLRDEITFPNEEALWAQVRRDLAEWQAAVASGELPAPRPASPKNHL